MKSLKTYPSSEIYPHIFHFLVAFSLCYSPQEADGEEGEEQATALPLRR